MTATRVIICVMYLQEELTLNIQAGFKYQLLIGTIFAMNS